MIVHRGELHLLITQKDCSVIGSVLIYLNYLMYATSRIVDDWPPPAPS